MKKLLFITLAALLLLCSCTTRVKPQTDISEKYYYMPIEVTFDSGSSGQTLARFNVDNGSITTLCPDPLCDHGYECPFYGVVNYRVMDNIIWFQRYMIGEGINYICQYDIASGKLRTLAKYEEDGYTYFFNFGYLWKIFTHDDPSEDYDSVRISLAEENFDDPEKLNPNKVNAYQIPFAQVGDVYYYAKYGMYHSPATEIRAMYTDLTDDWRVADGVFSMNFTYDGGYVYYIEKETLMRVSVDEELTGIPVNTKETVKDRVGSFFLYDGHLYYLQYEEDPESIGWDAYEEEDVKNLYGGKLWRANPDGSRAKVFMETESYVISKNFVGAQVGSKILLRYGCWKDKTLEGQTWRVWRAAEGGLLVVDLNNETYQGYAVFDE